MATSHTCPCNNNRQHFRCTERQTLRILFVLVALIVGTVAGIYLFGMIWQTTAPDGAMAMIIGGGTPVILGALAFLGARKANGQRPSLRDPRTWLALLAIAAGAAVLFVLLIAALFLVVQRG